METTIDTIIHHFQKCAMERKPQPPEEWMRGAMSINVLKQNESDLLIDLEQRCAELEVEYLEKGLPSNQAKAYLRKTDEWRNYQKQKARLKIIEEFVLLAKKHATLVSEQMKNNL